MAKRQKAVDIRTMREEQRAQRLLSSGHQDHEYMCSRQLRYPLCYRSSQYTHLTTAQNITLITITQNNCVAALYCVPVVPLTFCPPAGRLK